MLYIFDGKYFLNLYDVIHMGEPKFSNNTIKNELLLKLYDKKMSKINVDEHYTFLWKQNISLPYQISDTSNIYLIIHTTKKKEKSIRVFDKLFQKSLFAFQRSKKIHFNTCNKHMQNLVFLDKHLKFSNKHLMKFYSIALFQNHMTLFFCRGLKVAWARIGRTNFTIAASEWEKHFCICHAFSLQLLRSIVY